MDMKNLKEEGKKASKAVGDLFKTVKTEITTRDPDQQKAPGILKKGVTNVTSTIKNTIAATTSEKEFSEFDFSKIDMSSMNFYKSTENSGTVLYEAGSLWSSSIAMFYGKENIAIPNPFLCGGPSYGVIDLYDIADFEDCFEIEYPENMNIQPFSKFTIEAIYPSKFANVSSYNNYKELDKKGKIILCEYPESAEEEISVVDSEVPESKDFKDDTIND